MCCSGEMRLLVTCITPVKRSKKRVRDGGNCRGNGGPESANPIGAGFQSAENLRSKTSILPWQQAQRGALEPTKHRGV